MKTCCVIVTYGNRTELLEKTVWSIFNLVDKIIIIDNNSNQDFSYYEGEKINIIRMGENTGSAGGYKRGLQEAYKTDCDCIWLLDDDNVPQEGALDILLSYYESFTVKGFKNFALCSDRGREKFKKLESYIGNVIPFIKSKETETTNDKVYNIPVCPYGGMFFHKSMLERIGYPDERFFVYCDDYEWSYRITQSGGSIFLIEPSKVKDIDISDKEENYGKMYYSIRNLTYFKKKVSRSKVLFLVGYWLMRLYYTINPKKIHPDKVYFLSLGLKHGYKEILGKTLWV
jgi:GT2 family glycosyltransferase